MKKHLASIILITTLCTQQSLKPHNTSTYQQNSYTRTMEKTLKRYAKTSPIIGITGPRQSGKTTIAKKVFSTLAYVSFENIDVRNEALNDPRKFLARYPNGAIFDEVKYVPGIISCIQEVMHDNTPPGRFIFTSSQNISLNKTVAPSLTKHVAMLTLLPFSIAEINNNAPWQKHAFLGGYPRLYKKEMKPHEFYPYYIRTYVEHDVRHIQNIKDLNLFATFIRFCASHVGQVINFVSLAEKTGISHTTAREWLSILEASYILFRLPPYFENFNTRRTKMPKLYFYDVGLAASLIGMSSAEQVENMYLSGALYENLVISEFMKGRFNRGQEAKLYFWREATGNEVDLLEDRRGTIRAIEIKSSYTFNTNFLKNVVNFCKLTDRARGYVIYNGESEGELSGVTKVPFGKIKALLDT